MSRAVSALLNFGFLLGGSSVAMGRSQMGATGLSIFLLRLPPGSLHLVFSLRGGGRGPPPTATATAIALHQLLPGLLLQRIPRAQLCRNIHLLAPLQPLEDVVEQPNPGVCAAHVHGVLAFDARNEHGLVPHQQPQHEEGDGRRAPEGGAAHPLSLDPSLFVYVLSSTMKDKPLGYSNAKRPGRRNVSSGQYSQITPAQAQEFREAFTLLDKDGDGTIGREDLTAMLISLGSREDDAGLGGKVDEMLGDMPSPLNFAAFLTALSSHLCDITPREELLAAFAAFDEDDSGRVEVDELREALTSMGRRMSEDEAAQALHSFSNRRHFKYREFVDALAGSQMAPQAA